MITYNTLDHIIDTSAHVQNITRRGITVAAGIVALAVSVYALLITALLMIDMSRDIFGAVAIIATLFAIVLTAIAVDDIKIRTQAQIAGAIGTLYDFVD